MLETRRYEDYDLFWLDQSKPPPGWFSIENLRGAVDPKLSVSFFEDGAYVGSCGIYRLWHGVYEAWLVLLRTPSHHWEMLRSVKRALIVGQRLTNAHRIQAYSVADYPQARVLAKRLGFTQEAVMQRATPSGTDMLLFAKVRSS